MELTKKQRNVAVFLAVAVLFICSFAFESIGYSIGPNYRNISVDTTVNISNAKPEVLSVIIDSGADNVTLNAGMNRLVTCNASIRDYNGGNSLANVTAVFYDNTSTTPGAADDDNMHYSNTSCAEIVADGYYANYTCTFGVTYYANATDNWICNVTANDGYDFNGTDYGSNYNTTEILALYALNVTQQIDYGNLAVEDTSSAIEANITNFGNQDINISVYGYGATPGDGLAMVCDVGSIAIANEKFSLNATADFDTEYISLGSTSQLIPNMTLVQQTVDGTPVVNSTYWRLYVPPNPFGVCNGTIVFQAEAAS